MKCPQRAIVAGFVNLPVSNQLSTVTSNMCPLYLTAAAATLMRQSSIKTDSRPHADAWVLVHPRWSLIYRQTILFPEFRITVNFKIVVHVLFSATAIQRSTTCALSASYEYCSSESLCSSLSLTYFTCKCEHLGFIGSSWIILFTFWTHTHLLEICYLCLEILESSTSPPPNHNEKPPL